MHSCKVTSLLEVIPASRVIPVTRVSINGRRVNLIRGRCPLCPVGRTQLPLSHKQTSSDPTRRFRQVYDWGNLNGYNHLLTFIRRNFWIVCWDDCQLTFTRRNFWIVCWYDCQSDVDLWGKLLRNSDTQGSAVVFVFTYTTYTTPSTSSAVSQSISMVPFCVW